MGLKHILAIFFLLIGAFYFINFEASIIVWLAFFLNFVLLSIITYYHLYMEKVFSPFLSTFIVFNYIFFLVAPMSQINYLLNREDQLFLNNFPYNETLILKTTLLVFLFNVVFIVIYDLLKKQFSKTLELGSKEMITPKNLPVAIIIMIIITIVIILTNLDYIIYEYNRPEWMESDFSKSIALIKSKVLFIFPLGAIIACKAYFSSSNKIRSNYYIVLACFLLIGLLFLFVKNPLITKRHDLGPILFMALFLFIPRLVNTNVKFLNILFFSVIVGLPMSQLITHSDYGITELIEKPSRLMAQIDQGILTQGYISLNYDAFLNVGVIIEVVQEEGFSYGYQLLSALLFFIPRSLWVGKPQASGLVVGDHLEEFYNFNFKNVSNPFLSESYHNFGVIGVILFGILLAYICVFMLKWLHSNNWFKKSVAFYFALHLIFILRGDFTSSFAYFIATFLGIYLLPRAVLDFCNRKIVVKKE